MHADVSKPLPRRFRSSDGAFFFIRATAAGPKIQQKLSKVVGHSSHGERDVPLPVRASAAMRGHARRGQPRLLSGVPDLVRGRRGPAHAYCGLSRRRLFSPPVAVAARGRRRQPERADHGDSAAVPRMRHLYCPRHWCVCLSTTSPLSCIPACYSLGPSSSDPQSLVSQIRSGGPTPCRPWSLRSLATWPRAFSSRRSFPSAFSGWT